MTTITNTITVEINNVDCSSYLLKDSLYIRSAIGNKGDTASFILQDESGEFLPLDWDQVVVKINATPIFGGYITRRQGSGVGAGSNKIAQWQIECRDWTIILDTVVVSMYFLDAADTAIIYDLFDNNIQSEGFDTTTDVTGVNSDLDIGFDNITIRQALDNLAKMAGAQWHVSPSKSLYWYDPALPDAAAFDIDVISPNETTTFDIVADSLKRTVDTSTIINHVTIVGGEEETGKVTDVFVADGVTNTFGPLTKRPSSVWKVLWYADPGPSLQTSFASKIGYEPNDSLSIDGGSVNTLVNLETRYVKVQKTDGTIPKAGTNVTIEYYGFQQVYVEAEDETSQSEFGRVFSQKIYNEQFTNTALATEYANNIIAQYSRARETVSFQVNEYGLLPGRLVAINAPVVGLTSTYNDALALENGADALLLESGDKLMLENYGERKDYLIQDITIRSVVTGNGQFMVQVTVTAGKYVPTIFDSISTGQNLSAGTGPLPAQRNFGRLSSITNDLGDVVAGKGIFTDGGTAPFTWENYADHTGIVVGLEDSGANAYGAMYILNDGSVTTKVGRMDGLSSIGTVSPTGWGIWTENGYFSGAIAATAGEIGGWTIGNNLIYANDGTIATKALPINSSNPGVYITSDGLFGYGTVGLVFSIPTDPALKPTFSSGTILNTVYEITTASVLRTGTTNPRVQIDNSGIFAYNSGGSALFTVDASTGRMTATDGVFSGSITASRISGGTITGGLITGQTIQSGSMQGNSITGGSISATNISGVNISGAQVTGGTISGGLITGQSIIGGTITGGLVSGGTVSGGVISGGTVTGALVTGGTINAGGGNVILSSAGVALVPLGSYTNSASNNKIQWFSGGTVMSEIVGIWNGFFAETWVVAGAGGKTGYVYDRSYLAGTGGYCTWALEGNQARFEITGTNKFLIDADEVRTYVNILPDSSADNNQLGDSTHGFRYLYLKDDSGVIRRISVNASGVLTVT